MATATKSLNEILIGQWNDLGAKLLALGEAIPASAWDERPAEGVRTAGEVFRHVAFWNRWAAASARGESPDGAANEVAKSAAPSKAKALSAFEASVAEASEAFAKADRTETQELAASFLGHSAEHYGQLVVYARLRGIVPPASR